MFERQVSIVKRPEFENDSFFITIKNSNNLKKHLFCEDQYFIMKEHIFRTKDIRKKNLLCFSDRPSLRNVRQLKSLIGTVYTKKVEKVHGISYEKVIEKIKILLEKNERRAVLNFSDDVCYLYNSLKGSDDVSCVSLISYQKNSCRFVFRASDVKNELFYDLILLYKFFVLPVYGEADVQIDFISLSTQNHESFKSEVKRLRGV